MTWELDGCWSACLQRTFRSDGFLGAVFLPSQTNLKIGAQGETQSVTAMLQPPAPCTHGCESRYRTSPNNRSFWRVLLCWALSSRIHRTACVHIRDESQDGWRKWIKMELHVKARCWSAKTSLKETATPDTLLPCASPRFPPARFARKLTNTSSTIFQLPRTHLGRGFFCLIEIFLPCTGHCEGLYVISAYPTELNPVLLSWKLH